MAGTPRRLEVGPGKPFALPSEAARAARDGDIVEIAAGVYERDAAVWVANGLTLRGVGGRAHLSARGANAEGKGIWVIKGTGTVVEHVEFSGARVPEGNGAGIRLEGRGLTVRDCFFHDGENGILTWNDPETEVMIENSEFARNGKGDGKTHNIYVGAVKRFDLRGSWSHEAHVGHNVKSRAATSWIVANRITDEAFGDSSYSLDLPNGGVAYVLGNLIEQGPDSVNSIVVSYGAEVLRNGTNALLFVNNTVVNNGKPEGRFIMVVGEPQAVRIVNNIFAGPGTVLTGPGTKSHNLVSRAPGFVDAGRFDFRLKPGSPAIDAGVDPGEFDGVSLWPSTQYLHPAGAKPRARVGAPDLGAYEYRRGEPATP